MAPPDQSETLLVNLVRRMDRDRFGPEIELYLSQGPDDLQRRQSVVRDTVPPLSFIERRVAEVGAERNDNVGDLSVMFGNWGAMPSEENNAAQRRRVELQLRHCLAHILRLAECEEQVEAILQTPGKPPPPPRPTASPSTRCPAAEAVAGSYSPQPSTRATTPVPSQPAPESRRVIAPTASHVTNLLDEVGAAPTPTERARSRRPRAHRSADHAGPSDRALRCPNPPRRGRNASRGGRSAELSPLEVHRHASISDPRSVVPACRRVTRPL